MTWKPKNTRWQEQGADPDYRFSLANERTFLAWIRTALAILAGALIIHQLGAYFHLGSVGLWLDASLALVSAFLGGAAFFRWRGNEIAMRNNLPLPNSKLIPMLSSAVAFISLVGALALLLKD